MQVRAAGLEHKNEQPERETQEAVRAVVSDYGRRLRVPLYLKVCDKRPNWPPVSGGVSLCALVAPLRTGWLSRRAQMPHRLVLSVGGVPLPPGRRAAWDPEAIGVWGSRVYDAEGQLVCSVQDNQILVLFDLLGQEPRLARLLARLVLDLALPAGGPMLPGLFGLEPITLAEGLSQMRMVTEAEAVRSRAVSSSFAAAPGPTRSPEEREEAARELAASLQILSGRLANTERRLLQSERRLADLERQQRSTELLAREYDRLAALPGLAHAEVQGNGLCLYTEPITVEHQGRRFLLGRFRIEIHHDGRVLLLNLTHRTQGYDHPHIEAGRPCLGNVQEGLRRLLAQRELVAAASLILLYLQSVNPGDWRRPITAWPGL